ETSGQPASPSQILSYPTKFGQGRHRQKQIVVRLLEKIATTTKLARESGGSRRSSIIWGEFSQLQQILQRGHSKYSHRGPCQAHQCRGGFTTPALKLLCVLPHILSLAILQTRCFRTSCSPFRHVQSVIHNSLSLAQNRVQMPLILETLRVDLVNVLRAGRSRGKPAATGDNLQATDRSVVAGSTCQLGDDGLAGQARLLDGVRR